MSFHEREPLRKQVAASTEVFDDRKKFDFWHDICRSAVIGLDFQPTHNDTFHASANGVVLDAARVLNIDIAPHCAIRRPELDPDPAGIFVMSVTAGAMLMEQDGRSVLLGQGDSMFGVVDRPFVARCDDWASFSLVRLPRSVLLETNRRDEELTARSLGAVRGFGPLLHHFVRDFANSVDTLDNYTINRVSRICIDLLDGCFDVMADDVDHSRASYKSATLLRVKQFIEASIESENLSGQSVAAEMKLSSRYINRLFENEGTSLVRYIWSRRLERASASLANPRLRKVAISTIAYNLGFKNISHFSYAFHERFGMSPSDYRRQFKPDS